MPRLTLVAPPARTPAEIHGNLGETIDPADASSSTAVVSGTLYVLRLWVPAPGLVAAIRMFVGTAGVTLTANQNLVALHDDAGNKLSESGDQSTAWTTTGEKTMALGAAQQLPGGIYCRVAVLSVGTTPPAFNRAASSAGANMGLAGAALRFATGGTGLTAIPASINTGALTANTTAYAAILTP